MRIIKYNCKVTSPLKLIFFTHYEIVSAVCFAHKKIEKDA